MSHFTHSRMLDLACARFKVHSRKRALKNACAQKSVRLRKRAQLVSNLNFRAKNPSFFFTVNGPKIPWIL